MDSSRSQNCVILAYFVGTINLAFVRNCVDQFKYMATASQAPLTNNQAEPPNWAIFLFHKQRFNASVVLLFIQF